MFDDLIISRTKDLGSPPPIPDQLRQFLRLRRVHDFFTHLPSPFILHSDVGKDLIHINGDPIDFRLLSLLALFRDIDVSLGISPSASHNGYYAINVMKLGGAEGSGGWPPVHSKHEEHHKTARNISTTFLVNYTVVDYFIF